MYKCGRKKWFVECVVAQMVWSVRGAGSAVPPPQHLKRGFGWRNEWNGREIWFRYVVMPGREKKMCAECGAAESGANVSVWIEGVDVSS